MMLLDNNCRSMLFTLIQLSSCYANEDGYFFRSNSDLQTESNLSKNLVIVTIDTLYTNGLVDVKCGGNKCKKIANYYKLNFDKMLEYEKYSLEETKNPDNKITTLKYKNSDYVPSYKNTAKITAIETATNTAKSEHQKPQKVNTNIDSTNIDIIENINNKESNIYNNILLENEKNLEVVDSAEADVNTSTSTEDNKTVGANAVSLNKEFYTKIVEEIKNGCSNVRLNELLSRYYHKLSDLDRKEIKEYYTNYNLRKAS
nr:MAG TPA: hypothetical protein [Caudoviricetes sp.]